MGESSQDRKLSTPGKCFVIFRDCLVIFFSNLKQALIWPERVNVTTKIPYILLVTDRVPGEAISKHN